MTTTKSYSTLQSRIAAFAGRLNKIATKLPPRRPRFATDAEIELGDLYSPLDAPHTQAEETGGHSDALIARGVQTYYPGHGGPVDLASVKAAFQR